MIRYLLLTLATFTTLSAGPWLDAIQEDYEDGKYGVFLSIFERIFQPALTKDLDSQMAEYVKSKELLGQKLGYPVPDHPPYDFKSFALVGLMMDRLGNLGFQYTELAKSGKEAEAASVGFDRKKMDEQCAVLVLDLKKKEALPPQYDIIFDKFLSAAEARALKAAQL